MRTKRFLGLAALSAVALSTAWISLAAPPADKLPTGWIMAGSDPSDYSAGLAQGRGAYIASTAAAPKGFGTMMQMFSPDTYRGKRVRMSAEVRADQIESWAGLWMRVDGSAGRMGSLSFDNMQNRPIKGTSGWQRYEIVLDVPEASTNIAFGILLAGKGTAYVADFAFEVVPTTVPTTDLQSSWKPPAPPASAPVNLKFEN